MVTMEASSTTISWAMTTMTRMDQRLGSGPTSVGLTGIAAFVAPGRPVTDFIALLLSGGRAGRYRTGVHGSPVAAAWWLLSDGIQGESAQTASSSTSLRVAAATWIRNAAGGS